MNLTTLYQVFNEKCQGVKFRSDRRNLWFHYVMLAEGQEHPERWEKVLALLKHWKEGCSCPEERKLFEKWEDTIREPDPNRHSLILSRDFQQLRSVTPLGPLMTPFQRNQAHQVFCRNEL